MIKHRLNGGGMYVIAFLEETPNHRPNDIDGCKSEQQTDIITTYVEGERTINVRQRMRISRLGQQVIEKGKLKSKLPDGVLWRTSLLLILWHY